MTLVSTSKRPLERWSHLAAGPPLVRFAVPLRRHGPRASTPGSKLPSARRCQAPDAFRPRGFSPPRRFAPHTGPRVCCAPQPVRGSSRFDRGGAGPVRRRWRTSVRSPRDAGSHPSKSFPRRQPVPHHWGPLPSCRYRHGPVTAPAEADAGADPGEPGAAGPPRPDRPRGDDRAARLAGTCHRLDYAEAPIRPKADLHFTVARCGTGEPMPWRADHPRRRRRSDAIAMGGRSRMERHAQPAPEARLRGRRPKAPSPSRPTAETADDPGTLEPPKRRERTFREQCEAADYRALLRRRVRCVSGTIAGTETPDPSMGFVPLQGPLALRTSPAECRGQASAAQPKLRDTRDAGRRMRPTQASLGSLLGCPPVPAEARTRANPVAEAAFDRPPFQRGVRGPGPRPASSVRPKPSWNAGQCRRSLSGSEVVRRRSPMPVPPRSTPEGVVREAAEPRGGAHRPS